MTYAATLSVVLITCNHTRFIEVSIEGVLSSLPGACELVLVDDGSTDDTFSKVTATRHPAMTDLTKANGGPSSALNHGARAIVGAEAVVVGDVEPDTTVVGNPDKKIGKAL